MVKCGFDPRRITPHILKHTYISWLCQSGMPAADIAAYANTTEKTIRTHYQHVLPDHNDRVEQAVALDFGPAGLGLNGDLITTTNTPTDRALRRPTRAELEGKGLVTCNTARVHKKPRVS